MYTQILSFGLIIVQFEYSRSVTIQFHCGFGFANVAPGFMYNTVYSIHYLIIYC